jgi:FAD:protein FMN transferase
VSETNLRFGCFGSNAAVHVGGASGERSAEEAAEQARKRLLELHRRLTRFDSSSELSRLNDAPAATVEVSPLIRRFASAVVNAGRRSGGLVDATQLAAIEGAGYRDSREELPGLPLEQVLAEAPARRTATPNREASWEKIEVDDVAGTVTRPPGLRLDSGGIGKGLAADLIAAGLRDHPTFAVDCCGDIRIGGSAGVPRPVRVDDPFGGPPVHELELATGAVATSGIGRRAWLRDDGSPAHHLLDPASGRPAFTGIVQVTAAAPTAQLAEILAKTALLRGPDGAEQQLPHGGVLVFEDRSFKVIEGTVRTPLVPAELSRSSA